MAKYMPALIAFAFNDWRSDPLQPSSEPSNSGRARQGGFWLYGPARSLVAILAIAMLAACGGGNNRTSTQDVGSFRAINAVSDSPALTFFLESTNLGSSQFGQATAFSTVREGRFDLTARYTGLDNAVVTLLDQERVRIRVQQQTTLVLLGSVAAPVALEIQTENPDVATDATELQVLNTAGAGSVDLYVTEPGAALGAPLTSIASNAVSELLTASAGTAQLRLTTAGSSTVIFDSGTFVLPGGERTLLHIKPYFGPGDATLTVSLIGSSGTTSFPDPQLPATLRIANAIGDLPAADVSITSNGETSTITSLAANSFSELIELTPGPAQISVTMETDPGTLFVSNSAQLVGGEQRTLITAGNFSDGSTTGRLALDPQRPIATSAQINFIHGSASAGRVDAYLLSGAETTTDSTALVANLALLANSNREVLAGTYDLVFTRNGEDTTLAGPVSITVSNNRLYSILLTDAEGGGTPAQIIQGADFE